LLEGNPFVDEIVPVNRRSLKSVIALRRRLRSARYDLAVDFQGLIKSAVIAAAARPERLYGFERSQVRERPAALFYSGYVKAEAAHVVERNLELAQAAGASNLVRTFSIPQGTAEGTLPTGDFVLASPFAGWASKQWPAENYTALAERLAAEGLKLVLNVAPGSPPVAGTFTHVSGLPGLIYATRRAAGVVGVDSGPMHLAAAIGKPGVAIFGPTDPARNGPFGSSFAVLRASDAVTSYKRVDTIDPSMRAITVDAVYECLKARMYCAANS
jgi:heptosyltransferase-1